MPTGAWPWPVGDATGVSLPQSRAVRRCLAQWNISQAVAILAWCETLYREPLEWRRTIAWHKQDINDLVARVLGDLRSLTLAAAQVAYVPEGRHLADKRCRVCVRDAIKLGWADLRQYQRVIVLEQRGCTPHRNRLSTLNVHLYEMDWPLTGVVVEPIGRGIDNLVSLGGRALFLAQ